MGRDKYGGISVDPHPVTAKPFLEVSVCHQGLRPCFLMPDGYELLQQVESRPEDGGVVLDAKIGASRFEQARYFLTSSARIRQVMEDTIHEDVVNRFVHQWKPDGIRHKKCNFGPVVAAPVAVNGLSHETLCHIKSHNIERQIGQLER